MVSQVLPDFLQHGLIISYGMNPFLPKFSKRIQGPRFNRIHEAPQIPEMVFHRSPAKSQAKEPL
jgi:hypothetical protein